MKSYYETIRFDENYTEAEAEKRIMVSTWLNKKTINKLWISIFKDIIEKLNNIENPKDYNDIIQNWNIAKLLTWLMWVFDFHSTITWKSISDKNWGLLELKFTLWNIVNKQGFKQQRKNVKYKFLLDILDSKTLQKFCISFNHNQHRGVTLNNSESKEKSLILPDVWYHTKLVCFYADTINQILLNKKNKSKQNKEIIVI